MTLGFSGMAYSEIWNETAKKLNELKKNILLENLANLEHEQWSHWTKYFLANYFKENIERWRLQSHTPYNDLSEKEKESDREWARKVLELIDSQQKPDEIATVRQATSELKGSLDNVDSQQPTGNDNSNDAKGVYNADGLSCKPETGADIIIENIIRDIYWKFRIAIHSGEHCQIKIDEGKITSFKPLEDTSCYVCDAIHKLEEQIAGIFGDKYYSIEKVVPVEVKK